MTDKNDTITFDLERMKKAVEGPFFTLPNDLSMEDLKEFITKAADGKIEPDEGAKEACNSVAHPLKNTNIKLVDTHKGEMSVHIVKGN